MEAKQPPIYHSCLDLAGLVYAITRHFPRKAGYEEGEEMRKAATELVKDCLLANRAQAGSEERRKWQSEMEDRIALLEALVAIINSQKYCAVVKGVQRWQRLISSKEEAKLQSAIMNVSKQLYGWKKLRY